MKNRIKELREKNSLTLRGLGKEINMSSSRISQYETGKREPKLETWQKLADFFDVSIPYLQGIDHLQDIDQKKLELPIYCEFSKQSAIEYINKIMNSFDISIDDLKEVQP